MQRQIYTRFNVNNAIPLSSFATQPYLGSDVQYTGVYGVPQAIVAKERLCAQTELKHTLRM